MDTAVFQKRLSDLDIAMFCFPQSQPANPYNCTIVSLQLLRLISAVKSNILVPHFPRGVTGDQVTEYLRINFGVNTAFQELPLNVSLAVHLNPGFACLINLVSTAMGMSHSVIFYKTIDGLTYVIDPQTGKFYSQDVERPNIRRIDTFFQRHNIDKLFVLRYTERFGGARHAELSDMMDQRMAAHAVNIFYKRGRLLALNDEILDEPMPDEILDEPMPDEGGSRKTLRSNRSTKRSRKSFKRLSS